MTRLWRQFRRKHHTGNASLFPMIFLFALCLSLPGPARAALEEEKAILASGEYEDVIKRLEAVLAKSPENGEAIRMMLQARLDVGDYSRVLQQGEELLQRRRDSTIAESAAEAAMRLGQYDRAVGLLEGVPTVRADWLRGLLAQQKGQKQTAKAARERIVARWTQGPPLPPAERGLVADALAELGKFEEANQLYREAVEANPKDPSLKAKWGRLLLRKYNLAESEGLFREALELNTRHTGALLGMAELAASRWESQVPGTLERILQINPNLAEARVMLARVLLEHDDYSDAATELDQALQVNPLLLEAWSLRAAAEYLQASPSAVEQEWIPRILRENPSYGKVFADLGDFAVLKRQYGAAVEFYRRAVQTDPDLSQAESSLGINLFRLGKEEEALAILEKAYHQDPYNVWTVNTLRLMDSFRNYDSFGTSRFRVKLHQKESTVLRPYVEELLEKSIQDLSRRYRFVPEQKVVFEMYPDHEDFAVRTLGMPGLGALGATFGAVVAMDSPSARPRGEFHWGSTLWHELAHVISLGITDNRVPRWFTEGLSVYEENHARPGWGDPMNGGIVQALKRFRLIPLAELNSAFIRPRSPLMVPFAYFESGLICEFIAEKYGFPKILSLLNSYQKNQDDVAAFREVFGLSLEEFDKQFRDYARQQTFGFAKAVDFQWAGQDRTMEEIRQEVAKHPDNFFAQLHLAQALSARSQFEEAIAHAQAAKELFPPFVDEGNPYTLLADGYEALGRKEKAISELREWKEQKGRDPETFKRLAKLLKEAGHLDEAIQTLEQALYISVFDVEIHQWLGEWSLENSDPQDAIREFQVLLALDPPDKAEAHYRLATAYRAVSDGEKARQQVLAALEIAPGFRPAQKLLLELSSDKKPY
ncbi:MAG: tetratricopeptide repeat protein [Acidobacteria bacterium]|nr:tetratricopeptide repeat protein [Acidobacteriota bacterium]